MEVISGFHPVEEALKKGVPLHAIYMEKGKRSLRLSRIKKLASQKGVKVLEVPKEKLSELTEKRHQGVVALVSTVSFVSLQDLIKSVPEGELPLFVVLDGITDVGNVGAIIRTAEVAGAHGVIIPERNSPYFGEAMARASAGAIWHIPIARVKNLKRALEELKEAGIWCAATVVEGGQSAFEFDYNIPLAIVFGSEEKGVRKSIIEACDYKITLPQKGKTQSLNVSVAAGIIIYLASHARSHN